jgi:hypothetical protein
VSAAPHRIRTAVGTSLLVTLLGAAVGCGSENAGGSPGDQPSSTPTPTQTSPTPSPTPTTGGTPSPDCPDPISTVRSRLEKAAWDTGADKSAFKPVGVTICQYDAAAAGTDYANVTTKRNGSRAAQLFALINSAQATGEKPTMCTKELGPTYVLRFTDNNRAVLQIDVEAYGCRRVVAAFEQGGTPAQVPAPRKVTPQLLQSLGER